jgi:hypothetical protein
MIKNLLILISVCIAFFSLAQPPQSNSVSNGNLFNNQGTTTFVLDSVQLQRMDKDQIPAADDVEELNESEVRQQNNFKKEADVYKSKKVALKSNSRSRSASEVDEVQLQHSVTKLKGLAQTPNCSGASHWALEIRSPHGSLLAPRCARRCAALH